MADQHKRRVITVADIESARQSISVPPNVIITPLAADVARQRGIRIILATEPGPVQQPASPRKTDLPGLCHCIDHTNLVPSASESDIVRLCQEAKAHGFATVCVQPTRVLLAANQCAGSPVGVCAVVGFPSGAHNTAVKVAETRVAVQEGATEIDMVANSGLLIDDRLRDYADDISAVRQAAGSAIVLKVIIEASLWTDRDIVRAATAASHAGADFVKTSTGVYGQAQINHVRLLRQTLGANIKIKAAGGIKTVDQALAFIEAGADRLGTSSSMSLIREWRE